MTKYAYKSKMIDRKNRKEEKTMANSIEQEIGRRRTFAIISHPDAGKTTLTEKFL